MSVKINRYGETIPTREPDYEADEFVCEGKNCGRIQDIDYSVRVDNYLVCEDCAKDPNLSFEN